MRYWFASFYGNSLHDSKKSYGRVFKVRESNKELAEKLERLSERGYSYRWPDGWCQSINTYLLTGNLEISSEAKKYKSRVLHQSYYVTWRCVGYY